VDAHRGHAPEAKRMTSRAVSKTPAATSTRGGG
jgi:hypothetical protein